MATTEDTGSGGKAFAQTIIIDRALNGFVVKRDGTNWRVDQHVFEDFQGLFNHLNKEFGEDIPHDRTVKTGLSEAMMKEALR